MIKLMTVMSILLNLVMVGAVGGYYLWRGPEMQWFMTDYNQRPDGERELIRKSLELHDGTQDLTEAMLQNLYVTEELKERFTNADDEEAIQAAIVDALKESAKQIERRNQQAREATQREKIAAGNYGRTFEQIEEERKKLQIEIENFEREREAYYKAQQDMDVQRIIQGISKVKKIEDFQGQVSMLTPEEQLVVSRTVDPEKWAQLFNGMTVAEREAFNMARQQNYKPDMQVDGAVPDADQ